MNFYQLCDDYLRNLADIIDNRDNTSALEVDYLDGILKIIIKEFVISRRTSSKINN